LAATLKDIAEDVGVTPVTVSRALRGTGRISADTRQRILDAAQRLRYRPHGLARSMRQGRTGIVGLIFTTDDRATLPTPLLAGIQDELASQSYELMLGKISKAQLAEPGTASALLRHWMADGLLINHQIDLPGSIVQLIEEDRVPAVWMNSKHACNCVYFDDADAALRATRHLIELGHRRIAYLDYSHPIERLDQPEHYSVYDRFAGYVAAMNEADLPPQTIMNHGKGVGWTQRAAFSREWMTRPDRPTAVVCYGNNAPVLFAAQSVGLRVPDDLSILDLSLDDALPVCDVRVSGMYLPQEALGRAAVRRLLQRLATDGDAPEPINPLAIDMEFRPGQTCAPPPQPGD
jgi:LacI family transcriptional regulator